MEDTTETTTETTPADVDPIDALHDDLAAMQAPEEVAPEEVAPEPEAPAGWETRGPELEAQVAKERAEVRQWWATHFNSREKYEAFANWSKDYDTGGPAEQAPPPELELGDMEDEDIFNTVDQNKARMAKLEQHVEDMQRTRAIQHQQTIVEQTASEADVLAQKYPAVATEDGRRMMMQIALATHEFGGTMEKAAQRIQAVSGNNPQPQGGGPALGQPPARQTPTAIGGGGAGRSVAVQDGDSRESSWYAKENLDSMDVFDMVMKDSRAEFGIPH